MMSNELVEDDSASGQIRDSIGWKQWKPQYRLRTVFYFILLLGIITTPLARKWYRYQQQHALLERASYIFQLEENSWWFNLFGEELIDTVDEHAIVNDTALNSVGLLKACPNLRKISINGESVSDISPLMALNESLVVLSLYRTSVSDLSPLSDFEKIETLIIARSPVSDVTPLKNLTQLRTLCLPKTHIVDVMPLKKMSNLQGLNLADTAVSDVSPLSSMKNLRWLELGQTHVSDLSPLTVITGLEFLGLSNTKVRGVEPLASMKNLKRLHLEGTNVVDLSPLIGMPRLVVYLDDFRKNDVTVPAEFGGKLIWVGTRNGDSANETEAPQSW